MAVEKVATDVVGDSSSVVSAFKQAGAGATAFGLSLKAIGGIAVAATGPNCRLSLLLAGLSPSTHQPPLHGADKRLMINFT